MNIEHYNIEYTCVETVYYNKTYLYCVPTNFMVKKNSFTSKYTNHFNNKNENTTLGTIKVFKVRILIKFLFRISY